MPDTLITPTANTDLADLLSLWRASKLEEDMAKLHRLRIERAICQQLTEPATGEGILKPMLGLTITYSVTRKIEAEALSFVWSELSPAAQACFRWKPDLAKTNYDAAQAMAPAVFAEIAPFVTTTPAKPAFKFTEPKDQPNV